eukprot:361100-Chlamydomonas_euryale.AAC.24
MVVSTRRGAILRPRNFALGVGWDAIVRRPGSMLPCALPSHASCGARAAEPTPPSPQGRTLLISSLLTGAGASYSMDVMICLASGTETACALGTATCAAWAESQGRPRAGWARGWWLCKEARVHRRRDARTSPAPASPSSAAVCGARLEANEGSGSEARTLLVGRAARGAARPSARAALRCAIEPAAQSRGQKIGRGHGT